MNIKTSILLLSFFCSCGLLAQSEQDLDVKPEDLLHQIYLDEPVQNIDSLYYEKDGEKLDGTLSKDGLRIILHNYYKKGRVKAVVSNPKSEPKSISKSSCFIDPVIPM